MTLDNLITLLQDYKSKHLTLSSTEIKLDGMIIHGRIRKFPQDDYINLS